MKKIALIILLLLAVVSRASGQMAYDSAYGNYLSHQGEAALSNGKILIIIGAATAAAGGGLMQLAYRYSPKGEENMDNVVAPLLFGLGAAHIVIGAGVAYAGIPFLVAGNSIMQCDDYWRDVRYDKRGWGLILEGGYTVPDVLQLRSSAGYNFGPHIFFGGGIAPGIGLDKSNYSGKTPVFLPVYADFRWSMLNRLASPYLGLAAGMDVIYTELYLNAELGVRIRTSRSSNRSFWTSLYAESSYYLLTGGVKMGYSF